jgi:hypothetical protein
VAFLVIGHSRTTHEAVELEHNIPEPFRLPHIAIVRVDRTYLLQPRPVDGAADAQSPEDPALLEPITCSTSDKPTEVPKAFFRNLQFGQFGECERHKRLSSDVAARSGRHVSSALQVIQKF